MGHGFANPRNGVAIGAGTGIAYTGTVVLSNANGVSFGMQASASSNVVTMSVAVSAGLAVSAGTALASSGQLVLSNNGLVFGIDGQTVTMQHARVSVWSEPYMNDVCVFGYSAGQTAVPTQYNVTVDRVMFRSALAATVGVMIAQMNGGTNSQGTQGSYSVSIGAYTMSGSTASLASSASMAVTWSSGTATNDPTLFGGQAGGHRWQTMSLNTWSFTPGEYMLAVGVATSGTLSTANGAGLPQLTFHARDFPTPTNRFRAPGGGDYTNYFALGIYSVTTAALPSSFQLSDMNQTFSTSNVGGVLQRADPHLPYVIFAGTY